MAVIIFICHLFLAFAESTYQAHIVVLEAPIFRIPDEKSQVIAYKRKGDSIVIHPEEFNQGQYDHMGSNISEQQKEKYNIEFHQNHPDPMFEAPSNGYEKHPKFVRLLDRLGREAFILREHIEIDYKDIREFQYEKPEFDKTDYRIAEPLPKDYPLISPGGYRGFISLNLGAQNETNYPYDQNIRTKGYTYRTGFNGVWSKRANFDKAQRVYHGAMLSFSNTSNTFNTNDFDSTEKNQRFALGPYMSYDPFRNEKYTLTIYSSILFHMQNNTEIEVTDLNDGNNYKAEYTSNHFAGVIGSYFQKDHITGDLDFIAGMNFHFDPAHRVKTLNNISNNPALSKKSYIKDFTMELSLFIGLQSDY